MGFQESPGSLSQDQLITLVVFSALQIICLLVIAIAAVKLLLAFVRGRRLSQVTGVIVSHQQHVTRMRSAGGTGSRQVTLLKPVVRFTGPDGQTREVLHPIASSHPPPVGTEVNVAFDPAHPDQAEVVSPMARYLASTVVLLAVSLIMAILVGVEISALG